MLFDKNSLLGRGWVSGTLAVLVVLLNLALWVSLVWGGVWLITWLFSPSRASAQTPTYMDYAWGWLPANTPAQYRGQAPHLSACISGPLWYPPHDGCIGRFDFNGDSHVDLRDVWRYAKLVAT